MTSVAFLMLCAAALLGVALLAVVSARAQAATSIVYGTTLVITVAAAIVAAAALANPAGAAGGVVLPIGLPWIGAHFRIDALAAFFLATVNVGGAATSLYALGYGQHAQLLSHQADPRAGLTSMVAA